MENAGKICVESKLQAKREAKRPHTSLAHEPWAAGLLKPQAPRLNESSQVKRKGPVGDFPLQLALFGYEDAAVAEELHPRAVFAPVRHLCCNWGSRRGSFRGPRCRCQCSGSRVPVPSRHYAYSQVHCSLSFPS